VARYIMVSNRVPMPTARGAAGGLATALSDCLTPGTVWFGWSGRRVVEPSAQPTQIEAHGVTYATIDLTEEDYRCFYVGFANSVLWPMLHFQPGLMHFRREDYRGYLAVNRFFAESLMRVLRPDDAVWVHDYHLIPLGQMLREQGFRGRIGFFLHVPFVPPSILETLPVSRELMSAFCAYDVVGFQTDAYAQDFRESARHLLHARVEKEWVNSDGRSLRVIANPIGIDADTFAREAEQASHDRDVRRITDGLAGRTLVIGVDRLDYSKGLTNRFDAYARLLERHPEHRREICFLQICPGSRQEIEEYRRLRAELDGLTALINERFSGSDWRPLHYSTRTTQRRTLAGLYRLARIGVATPLRDGMNLVAKEFVAAQPDDDPGVLVLSLFAGAAQELLEALIVNPLDPDEIAEALHHALTMPASERKARHVALKEKVRRTSAQAYRQRFLEALECRTLARSAA
jgi:trehalose 6-phosphate synthase